MTGKRLLSIVSACLWATAATAATPDYPGSYSSGGVDSVQQLVLLEDHTFCYVVMAGSLDLLAGGRWKNAENPHEGIELQEVKAKGTAFPAILNEAATERGKVTFDFHGHSFSASQLATFAMSASDSAPETMRPLFPAEKTGWSPSYVLPAIEADKARYFFLGHVVPGMDGNEPAGHLSVTVYALQGTGGDVRIGFDRAQAMPALQLRARLQDETLSLQGQPFADR